MKSPFPGMDPYLEWHWLDLHPELVVTSRRAIQRQLGSDLVARIEERLIVEDTLGYTRRIGPHVRVVEIRGATGRGGWRWSGRRRRDDDASCASDRNFGAD